MDSLPNLAKPMASPHHSWVDGVDLYQALTLATAVIVGVRVRGGSETIEAMIGTRQCGAAF